MNLPDIPIGFATKLGTSVSALLAVAALLSTVIDGDHTEETIAALAGAIVTLYKVLDGRYQQAREQIAVDREAAHVPTEEELVEEFPDDAPGDEYPSVPLSATPLA